MGLRLRPLWAVLAALSVVSCSDAFDSGEERELEEARTRWNESGLRDYHVVVRLSCFCGAALPGFSLLTVQDDQVIAFDPLTSAPGAENIPLDAWPTVQEIFALIDGASQQSDYTEIEAQYDPVLGYPTRLELRCKPDALDCGAVFELQNLTPVTGGS